MPSAKDLLAAKGWGGVVTVNPDVTILEAARVMNERRVGSLLVIENDAVAGILTEKDVVYRVVASGKDPAAVTRPRRHDQGRHLHPARSTARGDRGDHAAGARAARPGGRRQGAPRPPLHRRRDRLARGQERARRSST